MMSKIDDVTKIIYASIRSAINDINLKNIPECDCDSDYMPLCPIYEFLDEEEKAVKSAVEKITDHVLLTFTLLDEAQEIFLRTFHSPDIQKSGEEWRDSDIRACYESYQAWLAKMKDGR
jgi:hypothetical protein